MKHSFSRIKHFNDFFSAVYQGVNQFFFYFETRPFLISIFICDTKI